MRLLEALVQHPLERLNREIRRRLVGAALAEQHDEWAEGRRYLTIANDLDAQTLSANNVLEPAA